MNKKLLLTSGIALMMVFIAITIPVLAEQNDEEIFGRTRITAIGTFAHCDVDGVVYGLVNVRTDGRRILCATLNEKKSKWDYETFESRF